MLDSEKLEKIFNTLDRSIFMEEGRKQYAHYDCAFSIGHGQTISQPSLVYTMTWCLMPDPDSKVLEIGTGSGYQTTLLAYLAREVYTVERVEELSVKARERLSRLGYGNVRFKIGDGSEGWVENAPYDRIMVTAAAAVIPDSLVDQLDMGGIMVIPVGLPGEQQLLRLTKTGPMKVERESFGEVRFVEFKGKYGWNH